jgi:hypothetical protein
MPDLKDMPPDAFVAGLKRLRQKYAPDSPDMDWEKIVEQLQSEESLPSEEQEIPKALVEDVAIGTQSPLSLFDRVHEAYQQRASEMTPDLETIAEESPDMKHQLLRQKLLNK